MYSLAPGLVGEIPVDGFLKTIHRGNLGLPAKQTPGFRDICPSFHDISNMKGLAVDNSFFTQSLFDERYDRLKGDGIITATQINDFVAEGLSAAIVPRAMSST